MNKMLDDIDNIAHFFIFLTCMGYQFYPFASGVKI